MCALSRSERCANCWSMTSRSATSPLRSSSSSASATESLTPARSTAIEILMPNMPNRSSKAARVAASTGSELSSRTKRSTDSIALVSSAASTPASFSSATNSLCRNVRAVSASSPDTGTTAWQMPGLVHLVGEPFGDILGRQHRVDTAGADLVGARRDPDDAERTCRSADQLTDLLEQRDIRGIQACAAGTPPHRRAAPRPRAPAAARCARRRRATATTCPACR